jgi:hypothetical protein
LGASAAVLLGCPDPPGTAEERHACSQPQSDPLRTVEEFTTIDAGHGKAIPFLEFSMEAPIL